MSRVRELRIKAALNVSRLAQLADVSRPTIEKMENDEAVRPVTLLRQCVMCFQRNLDTRSQLKALRSKSYNDICEKAEKSRGGVWVPIKVQ